MDGALVIEIILIFESNFQDLGMKWIGYILLIIIGGQLSAQKVTVSREILVRNNFNYDILPNIGSNTMFYHDRGSEQIFEVYDESLRFIGEVQPEFEVKNIQPIAVIPMDTTFNFYYSFRDEGYLYTRVIAFDHEVELADSLTISTRDKRKSNTSARYIVSQDKSKVLLFTPLEKQLLLQLVDNKNLNVIYEHTLQIEGINLRSEFEKITLTNQGDVFIITRKNSLWSRDKGKGFKLIHFKPNLQSTLKTFNPEIGEITMIKLDYDEKNNRLALGGLVSNGRDDTAIGYFGFSIPPSKIPDDSEIIINKFSQDFISEATGKINKKTKELSDYRIKDMLIRYDGGVILFAEQIKEFVRRNQMSNPAQFHSGLPITGYVDYYNENVILMATYPDGTEHWKKVLYKKQFSQDDNGVYSSYFLFQTPSRLRLLYNDEIKTNNTVSEYVLDPIGNFERKSVLSTEYQNLKLRFRDAIQTGPNSIIVPSERNTRIYLVKIDYDL